MSRTHRRRHIPPRRPARCPVCSLPWCSRVLLEMALKESDSLALLVRHFLQGEPAPGIAYEVQLASAAKGLPGEGHVH